MTIKFVGVAGSGTMGAGIVEVAAKAGFDVVLRSRTQEKADKAVAKLEKSLNAQVDKDKLSAEDRDDMLGRVRGTAILGEFENCDLVIESVVEDLDVKKELFTELDRICQPSAILATNTSTLPVVELAAATERPERVVGLHFFNPAPKMPLVEVVPALTTAAETVDEVRRFVDDCGKQAVRVEDKAGFVVNALLFPYLNNAVDMLDRGVADRDDIDAAMKGGCGFPMGPFELLDMVGLDVSLSVLNALHDEQPDTVSAPAPLLRRMVSAGHLGRKSGQGFYDYGQNGR